MFHFDQEKFGFSHNNLAPTQETTDTLTHMYKYKL